jgi:hypothetical protein
MITGLVMATAADGRPKKSVKGIFGTERLPDDQVLDDQYFLEYMGAYIGIKRMGLELHLADLWVSFYLQ